MLAIAPPNDPAPTITYNWHCQTASAVDSSGKVVDVTNGTALGTSSILQSQMCMDDMKTD